MDITRPRRRGTLALGLGLALWPALAFAQTKAERPRPPAVTDPAQADADFALQGEYEGRARRDGKTLPLGLQLVAQGEGKFQAVLLWGGLPGKAKQPPERQMADADAAREGEAVVAKGEAWTLTINGAGKANGATLAGADGKPLGALKRVERKSPTLGAKPPKGAVVLFAGKGGGLDEWDDKAKTEVIGGETLLVEGGTTKKSFGSARIHVEFRTPWKPLGRSQDRGNSGIYVQGRYEVQVLDSFGLTGKNNEAGGIYEVKDPALNMAFPPLTWQTYDIDFTAAKWEGDKKVAPAKLTVRHNGVVVQNETEIPAPTRAAPVKETPEKGPLHLQNHGNPVRYRNVWIVEK